MERIRKLIKAELGINTPARERFFAKHSKGLE